MSEPGRAELIRDAVAKVGCLVAEQGGRVVGYGVLGYSFFGQGFVSLLYVAAPRRRLGVGSTLLRGLERRCTRDARVVHHGGEAETASWG